MDLEIKLWDDTRSQVIQFYLARLFRRGNQNKLKLLYHFRLSQVEPDDGSLVPIMEIFNRESFIEDWEQFFVSIRELIYSRIDDVTFSPREKDVTIKFNRILATPQISTEIIIDGTAYLQKTPEITEHMSVIFKFMTTIDLLKLFQNKLNQILQNRDFKANIEHLPTQEIRTLYEIADDETEEIEISEEVVNEPVAVKNQDELVVKNDDTSSEMLEKIESEVIGNEKVIIQEKDEVTLEDWEEEEIVEIGGDLTDDELLDEHFEKKDIVDKLNNLENKDLHPESIKSKPDTDSSTDLDQLNSNEKLTLLQKRSKVKKQAGLPETQEHKSENEKAEIANIKKKEISVSPKMDKKVSETVESTKKEVKKSSKKKPKTTKILIDDSVEEKPKKVRKLRAKKGEVNKKQSTKTANSLPAKAKELKVKKITEKKSNSKKSSGKDAVAKKTNNKKPEKKG